MGRFARIGRSELLLPPIEEHQRLGRTDPFIRQIIRPPTIRIDIAKVLIQAPRKCLADDREVLVVRLRQSSAVRVGLFRRRATDSSLRAVSRELRRQIERHNYGAPRIGTAARGAELDGSPFRSDRLPSVTWQLGSARCSSAAPSLVTSVSLRWMICRFRSDLRCSTPASLTCVPESHRIRKRPSPARSASWSSVTFVSSSPRHSSGSRWEIRWALSSYTVTPLNEEDTIC